MTSYSDRNKIIMGTSETVRQEVKKGQGSDKNLSRCFIQEERSRERRFKIFLRPRDPRAPLDIILVYGMY